MRGEHLGDIAKNALGVGSPPHARGTQSPMHARAKRFRITPACAGNTLPFV